MYMYMETSERFVVEPLSYLEEYDAYVEECSREGWDPMSLDEYLMIDDRGDWDEIQFSNPTVLL